MEKILIAGSTGQTGKRVIEILNNTQNFKPVAMIRKEEQKQIFDDMEVESIIADLEGDIDHAFKGIDRVIFAAGSGSKTGPEKTTAVDQEGAKKMVDAAKKHNVKKFIMLSSMGTDNPEEGGDLEHYLKAKKEADDYLVDSGIVYTILQPGRLTDDMGLAKVKLAPKLKERGEISRDDVAFLLVMCLADPLGKNMAFQALEGEESIKSALVELSQNN
ncbi:SDR family oxidoreductase [Salegentibacter maritimus]|uniref:SDR family oxidoreductase n=1 Tax=Salegentibacter maritimus TaxID=2794347 RepID=UPI0018E41002|nr:SDR family oxidoreductase [Salegentibacter maritimus]MBI6117230.1 SDR family oxidoreductase [Salegentibacter maritimus]